MEAQSESLGILEISRMSRSSPQTNFPLLLPFPSCPQHSHLSIRAQSQSLHLKHLHPFILTHQNGTSNSFNLFNHHPDPPTISATGTRIPFQTNKPANKHEYSLSSVTSRTSPLSWTASLSSASSPRPRPLPASSSPRLLSRTRTRPRSSLSAPVFLTGTAREFP